MKTNFTVNELEVIDSLINEYPHSLQSFCNTLGADALDINNKICAAYSKAHDNQQRKQQLMGKLQDAIAYNGMTTVEAIVWCCPFTNKQAKQLLKGNVDKFTLKQLKAFHKEICEQ